MPGHSRRVLNGKGVAREFIHSLEIHHSTIVVILSGKQRLVEFLRMDVRQRVVMRIPSPIAGIESSHTRNLIVDEAELFVVTPIVDKLACCMLRMSHHDNVFVQILEGVLNKDLRFVFNDSIVQLTLVYLEFKVIEADTFVLVSHISLIGTTDYSPPCTRKRKPSLPPLLSS